MFEIEILDVERDRRADADAGPRDQREQCMVAPGSWILGLVEYGEQTVQVVLRHGPRWGWGTSCSPDQPRRVRGDETRPVQSFNILAEAPFSVLSGRSMQEITADPEAVWKDGRAVPSGPTGGGTTTRGAGAAPDPAALPAARRGTAPATLKPNLATRVDDAPPGDDWLHEIKLDGYRMMCRITGGEPRLFTRNGHDWTERMPGVAKAASRLPVKDVVLDGEVVILDAKGISDFQALQNAFRGGTGATFVYYVFDVLFSSGYDLRRVLLIDRKAYLEALLRVAPLAAPTIRYCDHIVGGGPVVFKQAAESGLEGIVSKRAASVYESRRTDSWLKVKAIRRQEFVIGDRKSVV